MGSLRDDAHTRWLTTPRLLLGLVIAVIAAHGGAIGNGFLYDDFHQVAENPAVLNHDWKRIWTSAEAGSRDARGWNYRPLTLTTYAVDHTIGAGRPAAFHATQLGLHAAVACLTYLIAIRLGIAPIGAIVGALLVGLHPAQIESAHYLTARSSVLSALCLAVSLYGYLAWRGRSEQRRWLPVSLLALALGVLSKESGLVGVAWLVAYERLVANSSWPATLGRLWPWALVGVLAIAPNQAISNPLEPAAVSTEQALATGTAVLGRHALHWVAPWTVAAPVPQPWIGWHDVSVWGSTAVLLVLAAVGYGLRRAAPLLSWGLASAAFSVLPVVVLPFLTNVALYQPHRGYLAAIPLAIATVALGSVAWDLLNQRRWFGASRSSRAAGIVLVASVLVVTVVYDARAGRVWRSEVRFWTAAVADHPREASYWHSLGAARLRADDAAGALEAFTEATRLNPTLPRLSYNLGITYVRLGRDNDAIGAFEDALGNDPLDTKTLVNLGRAFERVGRREHALEAYRSALSVDPKLAIARARVSALSASE